MVTKGFSAATPAPRRRASDAVWSPRARRRSQDRGARPEPAAV